MASTERLISIKLKLIDELSGELGKASNSLKGMADGLTSVGTKMTAAFTVPILAAGTAAVKMASDLDKSMHNIGSITKQTDESLAELSNQFLALSMNAEKTTDSADNLAKGYYQIVSSGIEAADAMQVLEVATKAASAGLTTTETAVKAITGTLNAYGLSAEHAAEISDMMFEVVNRGVVTYEELSNSLGNVTGLAAQLGIGFAEIGAATATMTKQNIDAATATTNLNGILTAMISPTDAMQKAIHDLGYENGSAMLQTLGLNGTLQALSQYTGGSAEQMRALFGDVRALRGALALTGKGAQMFADDLAAISNSAGSTQAAFAEQMKSFDAAWKNFQNTIGVALIEIGNILLPFLADLLTNYITPLVTWFINLDDATQGWIVTIALIIAAIGPLLIIFGQIAGAIVAIASAWATLSAGFATVGTLIAAITAPAWALIALFAAIGVAIALLIANWNQLGTTLNQLATIIDQKLGGIFSKMRDWAVKAGSALAGAWSEMLSKAGTAFGQLFAIIGANIAKFLQMGTTLGAAIIRGLIIGFATKVIELIQYVGKVANDIAQAIRDALGIKSPSKVMAEIGANVVEGFHKGIEGMGGVGVNVAGTSGGVSSQPTLSAGGAGGAGGGSTINIYWQLPEGTTDKQVREIDRKLGKLMARRNARTT